MSTVTATTRHLTALTPRQRLVLSLVAEGLPNKTIAERMYVSVETVRSHIIDLRKRLGAANKAQAVAIGMRRGEVR